MKDVENDVPKYRKKSSKKGDPRAKHKHEYVECVFGNHPLKLDEARGFFYDETVEYQIGTYCPLCGKIGALCAPGWKVDDKRHVGKFSFITSEWSEAALRQFDPATRTLPFFMLSEIFGQKYITDYDVSRGTQDDRA